MIGVSLNAPVSAALGMCRWATISLADNLMMVALALWILLSSIILTNSRLSRLRSPKPD